MKKRKTSIGWKLAGKVFDKSKGRCQYCGDELPEDRQIFDENGFIIVRFRNWDVDHIDPVSKGGKNREENLLAACRHCNRVKSDKPLEDFRAVFFSPIATIRKFFFEREDLHR
jgi:5-methylcytosine-specific restriction endonuclease McrA